MFIIRIFILIITQTIKLKHTDTCKDYEGISHPSMPVCCASSCGEFCGAANCDKGPGGSTACCASNILNKCGKAPCKLDTSIGNSPSYFV